MPEQREYGGSYAKLIREKTKGRVHPFGRSLFGRQSVHRVRITKSRAGLHYPCAFGDIADARCKPHDVSRAFCKPCRYRFAPAIAVHNGGMGAHRHALSIPQDYGDAKDIAQADSYGKTDPHGKAYGDAAACPAR